MVADSGLIVSNLKLIPTSAAASDDGCGAEVEIPCGTGYETRYETKSETGLETSLENQTGRQEP